MTFIVRFRYDLENLIILQDFTKFSDAIEISVALQVFHSSESFLEMKTTNLKTMVCLARSEFLYRWYIHVSLRIHSEPQCELTEPRRCFSDVWRDRLKMPVNDLQRRWIFIAVQSVSSRSVCTWKYANLLAEISRFFQFSTVHFEDFDAGSKIQAIRSVIYCSLSRAWHVSISRTERWSSGVLI